MKSLTAVTLVIAAAVVLVAGFAAPRTSATSQLCHSTADDHHGTRDREGQERRRDHGRRRRRAAALGQGDAAVP